jgi:hypothetical protein
MKVLTFHEALDGDIERFFNAFSADKSAVHSFVF